MIKIHQPLDGQDWLLREIKKSDLRLLEYGRMYRKYRKLMELSYQDHKNHKKVYLVAEVKRKIAGQIIIDRRVLKDQTKSDGVSRAYLYSFRVFPPFRRRGLGTAMLNFCLRYLKEKNFLYAAIACEKKNPLALKLYLRLGFKIFKEEDLPWEFEDEEGKKHTVSEPEWVLEKTL
ncbi:MAG: GNAT family N-acetyltransferase [Patescibacteria group bacterium]|nr:GNAT family N-acetyltransferase [Patescibacteria group bacterium]